MRFRVALAILISVLFIGWASWSRLMTPIKSASNLVVIQAFEENGEEDLWAFLTPKTATSTTSSEPLTNTDLIGRGLILDYVGLAANGQATEAGISRLADKYVESISTLNKAETIGYLDLKRVPDTKANFQKYADEMIKIHQSYAQTIQSSAIDESMLTSINTSTSALAASFSKAYAAAALSLKGVAVPNSLLQSHLKLVNSYLSSAVAMAAISNLDTDSAAGFAGLIALNQNLLQEEVARAEISQILTSNGI